MNRRTCSAWLAAVAASFLTACGAESPAGPEVRILRSGVVCGWLACNEAIEIEGTTVTVTKGARDGNTPTTATITPGERAALVAAVDEAALARLPAYMARHGLPVDGAEEWVEVVSSTLQKRVTIDYNADVPEIQPLLDRVRALRRRLGLM